MGGTHYKTNNKETTGHILGMHRHQPAEVTLPLGHSLALEEALQGLGWWVSTHRDPAEDVDDQGKERGEQLDPKAAKPLPQIFRQRHHLHKHQSRSLSDGECQRGHRMPLPHGVYVTEMPPEAGDSRQEIEADDAVGSQPPLYGQSSKTTVFRRVLFSTSSWTVCTMSTGTKPSVLTMPFDPNSPWLGE